MTTSDPKPQADSFAQALLKIKVGQRIGRFKVLSALGRGAMGAVVRAEDVTLKRHVALKLLPYQSDDSEQRVLVEQFIREARSAARLIHPNIVQVFEVGVSQGYAFIAMEILEKGSLEDLLESDGPLAVDRACELVAQAADGLAHAHENNIIHRDIKPANLMLAGTGHCKLGDFGLAHIEDPSDDFDLPWKVVGTPYYMAPEVAKGSPGKSSDIFALAGVLWYTLTGKPPFPVKRLQDVLKVNREIELPDLRSIRPEVPRELADVIGKGLSHETADRYASASEFAKAVREAAAAGGFISGAGRIRGNEEPTEKSSKKGLMMGLAAAVVLVIAGGVVAVVATMSGQDQPAPPPTVALPEPTTVKPPVEPVVNDPPPPVEPDDPVPQDPLPEVERSPYPPIPRGGRALQPDLLRTEFIENLPRDAGGANRVDVDSPHIGTSRGLRIIVRNPGKAENARLTAPLTGDVYEQDSVLVSFWARDPRPESVRQEADPAVIGVMLRRGTEPNQVLGLTSMELTGKWQRFDIPLRADFALPEDDGRLVIDVGGRKQDIELAALQVLAFDPSRDPAELPRSEALAIDQPTPQPFPTDHAETFNLSTSRAFADLARRLGQRDRRTFRVLGVAGSVESDGDHRTVSLLGPDGEPALQIHIPDAMFSRIVAEAEAKNDDLAGRGIVAVGQVVSHPDRRLPTLRLLHPDRLRVARDFSAIGFTDREAMIDAAIFDQPVKLSGLIKSIIVDRDHATLTLADENDRRLAIRLDRDLRDDLKDKLGGGDYGQGAVGRKATLQLKPRYDEKDDELQLVVAEADAIDVAEPSQPVARAIRVEVREAQKDPWRTGLEQRIDHEIKAGTRMLMQIRARSADGGVMIAVVQERSDWKTYGRKKVELTPNWQVYELPAVAVTDEKKNDWQIGLQLGEKAGTIEIADVRLAIVGTDQNLVENPSFADGYEKWKINTRDASRSVVAVRGEATEAMPEFPTFEELDINDGERVRELALSKTDQEYLVSGEIKSAVPLKGELIIVLDSRTSFLIVVASDAREQLLKPFDGEPRKLVGQRAEVVGLVTQPRPRRLGMSIDKASQITIRDP